MKNWFFRCVPVVLVSALAACGGQGGSSVPPPTNVKATAGDSYIQVSWDVTAGVDYFVFSATDPALTTLNWLNLTGGAAYIDATSPLIVCAAMNGQQRWFTVNGRTGAAPGGPGSAVVSATPRGAGDTWSGGATLVGDLTGIAFGVMTTCKRTALPTGVLTAVGPGATLYSSSDGMNWTRQTPPAGFTADLYAVANYTSSPDVTSSLGMRTIAVGAGGAALLSTDGSATWTVGQAFDASRPTLRGIAVASSVFVAVGDGGTIRSTSDGVSWNTVTSSTATNLSGVAYGNSRYIAVGDAGTLVTSTNGGVTWASQTLAGAGNLRAIAYGSNNNSTDNGGTLLINTFVAVGDNGVAVVSNDGGATWSVKGIAGASDFVGIAYTTRFVAVDRAGNAFVSATGQTWSGPIATGRSGLRGLVSNGGYGFIAVGDGGVTTSSF